MMRKSVVSVYLSGAMTGIEDFNRPAFFAAERELVDQGVVVVNPATLPLGLTDAAYMDIACAMVRGAEGFVSLKGHEHSKGAIAERALAERLGKVIFEQTDDGYIPVS